MRMRLAGPRWTAVTSQTIAFMASVSLSVRACESARSASPVSTRPLSTMVSRPLPESSVIVYIPSPASARMGAPMRHGDLLAHEYLAHVERSTDSMHRYARVASRVFAVRRKPNGAGVDPCTRATHPMLAVAFYPVASNRWRALLVSTTETEH